MQKHAEYMTAWIDTGIHDFLSVMEQPPSGMAYALITCLDSNFDVKSAVGASTHLDSVRGRATFVGKALLLRTTELLDAERLGRMFFGFDEVWFFARPVTHPKPSGLVIVGPHRVSGELLTRHRRWLDTTGCTLGLGDGTGMNLCFRVRDPRRSIAAVREEPDNTVTLCLR
jgi:hypothetical protein